VHAIRFIVLMPVLVAAAAALGAAPGVAQMAPVPLPSAKPAALKPAPKAKAADHKTQARATPAAPNSAPKSALRSAPKSAPMALTPSAAGATRPTSTATTQGLPLRGSVAMPGPAAAPVLPGPALRATPALAMAASASTSPLDLAAVKQALELVGKGRVDEATNVESTISDPVARKLVEWLVLRSDNASADFSRYAAFIAANPSWPSIVTLRRRAEAAAWQGRTDPSTVLAFFNSEPPHTAKGQFALARALLAQGDSARAQQAVSEAWRNDGFSADLEAQARAAFSGLITTADDKARMDARLYADDDDAALSAARHLDGVELAIAKARAAVINKEHNAKALLDAVPAAGQHDPGYIFSRAQWLRHSDKIAEAARWMQMAARDPADLRDVDQWWVERRLLARKLLDLGDNKLAYAIASGAATPNNENYRADQQFTAGWIALRFLHQPAVALPHFAHIADGVSDPITLARSYYWQGRAAEAAGHDHDARSHYEIAARFPTAYYGQLARARLGLDEVTLRAPPEPRSDLRGLELARVFDILYAIDARDVVVAMAGDVADKANDPGALVTLAEIARSHDDARATLRIGKKALGRGFPLELYAFPDFGIPTVQPIGPQVERHVIYAIVRQESEFNSRVVSGANAYGLMQVTAATGRDTAKRFNVAFDQRRLLNDVAYNVQIGSAELGNDISNWRGSYILAFVAYNAGPRRAKEWIEQYGDPRDPKVDPIDWIERIPVQETRYYVQRVIENMQVYRARFENNPKLWIESDLHRGS
jgi:soluble lytic murein transglycosylase